MSRSRIPARDPDPSARPSSDGRTPPRVRALGLLVCLVAATLASCAREPGHWICVSNEKSGTVSVIDGATRAVIATIPLGKRPRGIHASPDGSTLYVALSGSPIAGPPGSGPPADSLPPADRSADGIGVVDLRALRLARVIKGGIDPEQFAISPDGSTLYIANEDAAALSLVRTRDGSIARVIPMGEEPEGVGIAPGGQPVMVTCEAQGEVFFLDPTGIPLGRVMVPGRPRSVAFLPDGSRAYVPAESHGTLSTIDVPHRQPAGIIALPSGSRPMGTAMARDGKTLYVSNGRAGTVSILDVPSLRLRANVKVGARPWGIGLSPNGRYLYVANGPSNDVSVIDTQAGREVGRIRVGEGPWGIAVVPSP
ncbi:MAG: beta-propeller fold lactonase family protein [Bacteroidota bacterium]